MARVLVSPLVFLLSVAVLRPDCPWVSCYFVFNVTHLTHSALAAYEKNFQEVASNVLQKENTTNLFAQRALSSSGYGQGKEESEVLGVDRFKEMMKALLFAVDTRYSGVLNAIQSLKTEFEKNIQNGTRPLYPRLQYKCCGGASPVLYRYQGRYRDDVNISRECWGRTPDTADQDFRLRADDAFDLMKKNYERDTAILWQYVATLDGHFVQFPSKNRHCDGNGNSVSPFGLRWMVGKVLQRRLGVVMLLDAGAHMLNTAISRKDSPPIQHWLMVKDAAKRVVNQLVTTDRVTVIVLKNQSALTPPGCRDRLLVGTKRNADVISDFLDGIVPEGLTDLSKGFSLAYNLLSATRTEQNNTEVKNVILLLTNGMASFSNQTDVLDAVDKVEKTMDRSVHHLVYVVKSSDVSAAYNATFFSQLAGLNSGSSTNGSFAPWPIEYPNSVGPTGRLTETLDSEGFNYSNTVARFYTLFPPEVSGGLDRILAASPFMDPKTGLLLTFAVQVFNGTGISKLHGVAAVEVSVATLFSDVTSFQWGVHSYAFLLERARGLVLVHPKLETPSRPQSGDPAFSTLEFLEPSFTREQRQTILAANSSIMTFTAKVSPGRSTYKSGRDLNSAGDHLPASILYSRLVPSDYVIVLVIFDSENSLLRPDLNDIEQDTAFDSLTYHHHLFINGSAADLCVVLDDFQYRDKVTVKFSPSLFVDPELYKYTRETDGDVVAMTAFLSEDKNAPPKLRRNLLGSIIEDLVVMNSMGLTHTWIAGFNHGVTERFMATPIGLYMSFPGVSLPNTYDPTEYGWYQKSVAWTDKILVTFRRSLTSTYKTIAVSSAIATNTRVYGVTGVGLPSRAFAGLFYNSFGDSDMGEYSYHLMMEDGYLLDVLNEDVASVPAAERHLAGVYPWLAVRLSKRNILKVSWCTVLSQGRHKLTYRLDVSNGSYVTHDPSERDECRMFVLKHVRGTNLLVLAVADRSKQGCSEWGSGEKCTSCPPPGGHGGRLPRCTSCLVNTSTCQCPCYCDVDYNVCRDSFQHLEGTTFPITPCYEEPSMPTVTDSGPDKPLPGVPLCGIQCPAFRTQEDCGAAADRCRWNDDNVYPVCEPLSTTTATSSASTPSTHRTTNTTSATTQPSAVSDTSSQTTSATSNSAVGVPTTRTDRCDSKKCHSGHASQGESKNSGLSRGAIAGIVIGVVCLVGVVVVVGAKLCRVHQVCKDYGKNTLEIEGTFDNALSNLSQDTLQLTSNIVSPLDTTQPSASTTSLSAN